MNELNGFNRIARYYDVLKRLVFGNAIRNSEIAFLECLTPGGNVLILGGGSGEILGPLFQVNPGCRVWFVEASSRMISKAVYNLPEASRGNVCFIHGTEGSLPPNVVFDGIITNFFLDLFSEDIIPQICGNLNSRLSTGGTWLVSDFVDDGRWWHRFLLSVMYRFFRFTCGISTSKLPDWQRQLRKVNLVQRKSALFYEGFIKSCVYERMHSG